MHDLFSITIIIIIYFFFCVYFYQVKFLYVSFRDRLSLDWFMGLTMNPMMCLEHG